MPPDEQDRPPVNVGFASITYGPIEPMVVSSHLTAVMQAWRNGVRVVANLQTRRLGWAMARDNIANDALGLAEIEGVFWADSDIVLPRNAILRLSGAGVDVFSGIYYKRKEPHYPLIGIMHSSGKGIQWLGEWPEVPFPVDGCGFGCVYTSKRALQAAKDLDDIGRVFRETGQLSEDFDFCERVRRAGLTVWVDPEVVCEHLGEARSYGRKDFEEHFPPDRRERELAYVRLKPPGER